MTSPRVIELPRRLEPVGRDPFLGGAAAAEGIPRPAARPGGNVIPLRSRDALSLRRPPLSPPPPAAA